MSDRTIHIFNERAESILTVRALEKRVGELEAENHKLKQLLARQARRLAPQGELLPQPVKH